MPARKSSSARNRPQSASGADRRELLKVLDALARGDVVTVTHPRDAKPTQMSRKTPIRLPPRRTLPEQRLSKSVAQSCASSKSGEDLGKPDHRMLLNHGA
jgi:hypothetical protein